MAHTITIPGVGSALRALRAHKGWSQKDLAAVLGCDKTRISKYETGRVSLSVDFLEEVAKALGHRPEAVILYVIRERFPAVADSEIGQLLEALAEKIRGAEEPGQ